MDNTTPKTTALSPLLSRLLIIAALSITLFSLGGIWIIGKKSDWFGLTEPTPATLSPTVPVVPTPTLAVVSTAPTPAPAPLPMEPVVSPAPPPKTAQPARKRHVVKKRAAAPSEPAEAASTVQHLPSAFTAENQPSRPAPTCHQCGHVASISPSDSGEKPGGIAGTLIGGVAGGLLGNQFGSGRGRDIATLAGAVGGAFAGNQVQKNYNRPVGYEVLVRFEGGGTQSFHYDYFPGFHLGQRVRIAGGRLEPN